MYRARWSDERRFGHAGPGYQGRNLFGCAAVAGNWRQDHSSVSGGAAVTPQGFDYLRNLRERSGLVLAAEKQYLAESRLLPVARRKE